MIPIYKAKKIDSDEDVEGLLHQDLSDRFFYCISKIKKEKDNHWDVIDDWHIRIDLATLCVSFDDGKSFIKLSDLEVHTCTDFKLEYTNMQMNNRKDVQPPNGSIFTIITNKGI